MALQQCTAPACWQGLAAATIGIRPHTFARLFIVITVTREVMAVLVEIMRQRGRKSFHDTISQLS